MKEYPCHIPSSGSGSGFSSGSASGSVSGATSTSNTSSNATCSKAIGRKKVVTVIRLKNKQTAQLMMKDEAAGVDE